MLGQGSDLASVCQHVEVSEQTWHRWGWRKAHAIARREALVVNRKRTRRLWREDGLERPAQACKPRRLGEQRGDRIEATRPDQVWALDFQYDVTSDGRQLRFLNIVDESTREASPRPGGGRPTSGWTTASS